MRKVNSRLRSSAGLVRLMVDPVHAPHVVLDFEGVTTLPGGSGEIAKKKHLELTKGLERCDVDSRQSPFCLHH